MRVYSDIPHYPISNILSIGTETCSDMSEVKRNNYCGERERYHNKIALRNREIVKIVNSSLATVQYIINKSKKGNTIIVNLKRSGRPKRFSEREQEICSA